MLRVIEYFAKSLVVLNLLPSFHVWQAAIKLPGAEASKRAQCTSPGIAIHTLTTSPGQYTPCIKGRVKTLLELN